MSSDIKLKRLCQRGESAKFIKQFLAKQSESFGILDSDGRGILGDSDDAKTRHPILLSGDDEPIGWVSGEGDDALLLVAVLRYIGQKELESKLLAQETLHKYKELTLLYELGEKIAACLDIEELAWLTLEETRRLLPSGVEFEMGILLNDQDSAQLTVCAGRGLRFQPGSNVSIDGITRQVLTTGHAEIINAVPHDPRYLQAPGMLGRAEAMLVAPLKTRDHTFGVLMVVSDKPLNFSAGEAKILNLLASQTAVALGRVHLIRERVAQERLQESLQLSRSIQMGMLSTDFPRFSDGNPIDLYAFMAPAREVGGDFYDFFFLDRSTVLLAIGDVSDKGVPAALFMVMVKTLIRAIAKQKLPLHLMMAELNPELCRDNEAAMFVTLFLATLNVETGELNYSFGGHNRPLYLAQDGSVSMLAGDSGTALGIIDGIDFTSQSLMLKPGESLILYTDGINEAMDINHNAFGDQPLCDLMVNAEAGNAQALVEKIIHAVLEFTYGAEQSDDMTLLAVQMRQ